MVMVLDLVSFLVLCCIIEFEILTGFSVILSVDSYICLVELWVQILLSL